LALFRFLRHGRPSGRPSPFGAHPAAVALALCLVAAAGPQRALAHQIRPEQVAAFILGDHRAALAGVVRVEPSPDLPRLLVVEVDARWPEASEAMRLEAVSDWRRSWREAEPQGLLGVVDAAGVTLVGFDAEGRPYLEKAPAGPAALPHTSDPGH
jgi:hypothetical protein